MSLLLILRGAAPPARNAALAVTEAGDVLAATMAAQVMAALAATEALDTLLASMSGGPSGDSVKVHTMLRLGRMMRH